MGLQRLFYGQPKNALCGEFWAEVVGEESVVGEHGGTRRVFKSEGTRQEGGRQFGGDGTRGSEILGVHRLEVGKAPEFVPAGRHGQGVKAGCGGLLVFAEPVGEWVCGRGGGVFKKRITHEIGTGSGAAAAAFKGGRGGGGGYARQSGGEAGGAVRWISRRSPPFQGR